MRRMSDMRTYVKVTSDFDCTGYMQPRVITWKDGRTFRIDAVKDLRGFRTGDCYTVVIQGQVRYLYYERPNGIMPNRFGRWFVMQPAGS